jgi:hypothetical protein
MTNDRCRLQISANKNTARAPSGEMLPPLINSTARRFSKKVEMRAARSVTNCTKGLESSDWKPTPTIRVGVREVRIRDGSGAYRVIDVRLCRTPFICCTRSRRNRKRPHGGTWRLPPRDYMRSHDLPTHSTKRLQLSRACRDLV